MGAKLDGPFQLAVNASLKVDFQRSRVTSDGGLILVCKLNERLRLDNLIPEHLTESQEKKTQLPLADLLHQLRYPLHGGIRRSERRGTSFPKPHSATDQTLIVDHEVESPRNLLHCVQFRTDSLSLTDLQFDLS
jgi:hypothetical protein